VIFASHVLRGSLAHPMIFRRDYSAIRRSPRQWWNSSVEVFTDSVQVKAVGVNISDGGMCLFAVANLHVGSAVEVMFHAAESQNRVRIRGTVRHRALYLYGIEFFSEPESGANPVQVAIPRAAVNSHFSDN
jgi:c-di-GMP-binding flagellar brake protein YcgR